MSSSANNNNSVLFNRLYLKNIPMDVTKSQLKDVYFQDIDVDIHFPKFAKITVPDKKVAFLQFGTANEGKLALMVINLTNWKDVTANFARVQENKTYPSGNLISACDFDLEVRKCSLCGTLNSNFECNTCSNMYSKTFYCSQDCQMKHWKTHSKDCKPLPKLKRVADKDDDDASEDEEEECQKKKGKYTVPSCEFPTKLDTKFIITSVETNRLLYVRMADDAKFESMLYEINKSYINAPKILHEPDINDYSLAPLNDNEYHRARVLDKFETDSDGCNVKVMFIDIGCEKTLKWNTLKRLTYKQRGMPIRIFRVVLEGVIVAGSHNMPANQFLKDICDKKELLEIVSMSNKSSGERRVVLKQISNGTIINERINEMLMSQAVSKVSIDDKIFYDSSLVPAIKPIENVKLGIADNSQLEEKNYLACMPYELLPEYRDLSCQIQEYCKNSNADETYNPLLNEIYLLKYNNKWQRAINATADKIILIDKMLTIPAEKHEGRRRIPQLFAKKLFTSHCYVEKMDLNDKKELLCSDHAYFKVGFDVRTKCIVLFPKIKADDL